MSAGQTGQIINAYAKGVEAEELQCSSLLDHLDHGHTSCVVDACAIGHEAEGPQRGTPLKRRSRGQVRHAVDEGAGPPSKLNNSA